MMRATTCENPNLKVYVVRRDRLVLTDGCDNQKDLSHSGPATNILLGDFGP